MKSLELAAHAKINLSLDIIRKRDDGYHQLRMIMQTVDLHDNILIEAEGNGLQVDCDSIAVPSGPANIAYKAAALIKEKYGIQDGLKISILKKIPSAAGLAGGSADAAAVIRGLDSMFSLGLTRDELVKLGKQVGADVPFCIAGGTMLAEGIGEILKELKPFSGVDILILKPKVEVSTAWAFKNFNPGSVTKKPDTELIIEAISNNNINLVAKNMRNLLETVTIPHYPVVQQAKERLMALGAAGSIMSGSGPSVFGIFSNRESAAKAFEEAQDSRWERHLTQTA